MLGILMTLLLLLALALLVLASTPLFKALDVEKGEQAVYYIHHVFLVRHDSGQVLVSLGCFINYPKVCVADNAYHAVRELLLHGKEDMGRQSCMG